MCGERVAVFAAGAQHPDLRGDACRRHCYSPSPKAIADAFMPQSGAVEVLVEAERRQGQRLRVILQVRDEAVMISGKVPSTSYAFFI